MSFDNNLVTRRKALGYLNKPIFHYAKKQPVELGIMEDWLVQITKGLSPGDQVVVEGHRDIDDGYKLKTVRVIDELSEALL